MAQFELLWYNVYPGMLSHSASQPAFGTPATFYMLQLLEEDPMPELEPREDSGGVQSTGKRRVSDYLAGAPRACVTRGFFSHISLRSSKSAHSFDVRVCIRGTFLQQYATAFTTYALGSPSHTGPRPPPLAAVRNIGK
ncbi:hypothetical protein DFH09DRAFT_1094597 [Mycena vulgaris]|nr:hypothetical protein DFH09DRAFT_1094597 [Mycena vulgaris]